MTYLLSTITGIVSGLISSVLIFGFWQIQKPRLEISKDIAKNSKGEFRVKIVNKTSRYISNVIIRLQVVKRTNGHNGDVYNTYNLQLPYSEIMLINPRKDTKKNTDYAIRFVLPKDLEKHWVDDTHTSLKLIIHCSNEFNTASKTYEQYYHRKSTIKNGEFVCGDSMRILEETTTE